MKDNKENKAIFDTQLLPAFDSEKDKNNIDYAAQLIKDGQLVVFPTETVYGIGANALNEEAVLKIFEAKGRPQDNPLIVHIASMEELYPLVREVSSVAKKLAEAFWPGALTMIFPRSEKIPARVSAGLDTVAVRMPSHPVSKALIIASGVPLAAPSANRSGSPSPTLAKHALDDLNGRVPLILDGGGTEVGLESTVISFENGIPKILRPGGITPEQIREVAGNVVVESKITPSAQQAPAYSPGLKYKHYTPKAQVVLLRGTAEEFATYCKEHCQPGDWAMAFEEDLPLLTTIPSMSYGHHNDVREQGRELFSVLRALDDKEAKRVLVHAPTPKGVGLAVYDRLLRAASFKEIQL